MPQPLWLPRGCIGSAFSTALGLRTVSERLECKGQGSPLNARVARKLNREALDAGSVGWCCPPHRGSPEQGHFGKKHFMDCRREGSLQKQVAPSKPKPTELCLHPHPQPPSARQALNSSLPPLLQKTCRYIFKQTDRKLNSSK